MRHVLLLLVLINVTGLTKQFESTESNQPVSDNKKNGFVIQKEGKSWINYLTYKDDTLQGFHYQINSKYNTLSWIHVTNKRGDTIFFARFIDGELSYICDDFKILKIPNKYFPHNPVWSCHNIYYGPGGKKKSEGRIYYFDDLEIDCFMYGKWTYYDDGGNIKEIRRFKKKEQRYHAY